MGVLAPLENYKLLLFTSVQLNSVPALRLWTWKWQAKEDKKKASPSSANQASWPAAAGRERQGGKMVTSAGEEPSVRPAASKKGYQFSLSIRAKGKASRALA